MSALALTLATLAVATALVYVVIAIYIVPRIDLNKAGPRVVVLVRGGAVAFFMGCALTHAHMALHLFQDPSTASLHELSFHIPQVLGGWLFVAVCGRHLDISVVHKTTAQEREAQKRLAIERQERDLAVKGSQLKSAFLANMSHEIRTPMNGVIGIADALLDTPLDESQLDLVRMIRTSGDSLLAIINDILDISKIEAGGLEIDHTEMNIADLAEDVCALFSSLAKAKGLCFDLALDPSLDRTVEGDPQRVRQALSNLVGNAVKFTDVGFVRLTVTDENGYARFEVTDSGPGVEPDLQDAIFDEFAQGDPSTSRTYGGTGLGLAIARRLADAMGGALGMSSEVGQGSTFWFTVRVGEASSHQRVTGTALRGRHTVVVLNEKPGRVSLDRLLGSWGMLTTVVSPARVGTGVTVMPDVVVIDASIAMVDADALTRRVRGRWPATPVLLLSMRETAPLSNDKRFTELVKPVRRSTIYNALTALFAADAEPLAHAVAEPGPTPPENPERQLLLVEDDRINQRVAVTMLTKMGYSVVVAQNGREAVELGTRAQFAAVLMDCQMPELDGYEATRELRRHEPAGSRTPIIAMTAHSMTTDRTKCLNAGMDDYISKPVRPAELQAVLARWLPASA